MLTPADLIRRAAAKGVRLLALTDHDETGGLDEASRATCGLDVVLIPGVEISAAWQSQSVHVLGLDIDPCALPLSKGLAAIRRLRSERAVMIAGKLESVGITGSLAGAMRHAGGSAALGRNHFARYLVEHKHARNPNDAFHRYLGTDRIAYAPLRWPDIEQAVDWIHCAGGQAVLAHPDRYRLTPIAMQRLFEDFAKAAGDAIEITSAERFKLSPLILLARKFGFALSSGSDFHAAGKNVPDLGQVTQIPSGERPLSLRLRSSR